MPVTPARNSAAFTSARRSGRMMRVISFMWSTPVRAVDGRLLLLATGPGRPPQVLSSHASYYLSRVVIHEELVRVGPQVHGRHVLSLHAEPGIEHVLGEHVALEEELVVLLQRIERLGQAAGH